MKPVTIRSYGDENFCMIGLKKGIVKLAEHQEDWKNEAEQTIAELKTF